MRLSRRGGTVGARQEMVVVLKRTGEVGGGTGDRVRARWDMVVVRDRLRSGLRCGIACGQGGEWRGCGSGLVRWAAVWGSACGQGGEGRRCGIACRQGGDAVSFLL